MEATELREGISRAAKHLSEFQVIQIFNNHGYGQKSTTKSYCKSVHGSCYSSVIKKRTVTNRMFV